VCTGDGTAQKPTKSVKEILQKSRFKSGSMASAGCGAASGDKTDEDGDMTDDIALAPPGESAAMHGVDG